MKKFLLSLKENIYIEKSQEEKRFDGRIQWDREHILGIF